MKFRLFDKDRDYISANGKDTWTSFEDCQEDVKHAAKHSDSPLEYLPFSFVDVDSSRKKSEMDVYGIIKDIEIDLSITNLRVVPYAHRT